MPQEAQATEPADESSDLNVLAMPLTSPGRPVDGDPGLEYIHEGSHAGLYRVRHTKKGVSRAQFLSWCPEVTAHLVELDESGRPISRSYEVRVGDTTCEITSDTLRDGSAWRERAPQAAGFGRSQVRDALENVVTSQAVNLRTTYSVRRSGWYDMPDGGWVYVRAGQPADGSTWVRTVGLRAEVERASQPEEPSTPDELDQAVKDIASHGWGPIMGLAAGMRALAWTLEPVRGSLIPVGIPNSGKSLTAWMALMATMTTGWPPLVDASFNDTAAALELKFGQATDRALTLEDLPLTASSAARETKDALEKFDRVTRSVFNDTAFRDRMNRESQLRASSKVMGIPVITAQRLPAGIQPSTLRRVVLAEFERGDNDWRWYSKHGTRVRVPVRTMGDRIIAKMEAAGKGVAREWVQECDAYAARRLAPLARQALGQAPDGMDGVVRAASQMLGGLAMIASACDLDVDALFAAVMPKLARSLASQAQQMDDGQVADTGISDALGDVVRAALLSRRAHIRDPRTNTAGSLVPGQTPQQQGLREDQFRGESQGFGGDGVPAFWVEDRAALGVTAQDLHTLITASGDARLTGRTPRSLPAWLLREGAVLQSTQKGQVATTRIRLGAVSGLTPVVLIPAHTVFTLPESPDDTTDTDETDDSGGDGGGGDDDPEPMPTLPGLIDSPTAPEAPAPVQVSSDDADTSKVVSLRHRQDRQLVYAVCGDQLVSPDGTSRLLSDDGRTRLEVLLAEVPSGDVHLLVDDAGRKAYRFGRTAPSALKATRWDKAFAPLVDAGWHRPGQPGEKPFVGPSTALARPDGQGQVRITVVPWLGRDDFPLHRTRQMREAGQADCSDLVTLAYRLAQFEEAVGYPFAATVGATGLRMMRNMVQESARQWPRWHGVDVEKWPSAVDLNDWSTKETQGQGWLHSYDANKAYLPAYRNALVARDSLTHYKDPVFDESEAGFWLVRVPEWAHEHLPAPLPDVKPGSMVWTTTAVVKLYVELGISPEVVESWTAPAVAFQGMRHFTDRIRDTLKSLSASADPDDAAVTAAVKGLFQTTHGKLRDTRQGLMRRPDWGHAVRDAGWTTTLRRVYVAAGLIKYRGEVAPEPRYPVAVKTDEITYSGSTPDAASEAPYGIRVGDGLGQHTVTSTQAGERS